MSSFEPHHTSSRLRKYQYPGFTRPYYSPILEIERMERKAKLQRDLGVSRKVTEDILIRGGYEGYVFQPIGLRQPHLFGREERSAERERSSEQRSPSDKGSSNPSSGNRNQRIESEVIQALDKPQSV